MNLKDNWWKFLVLGAVVVGLIWWRQQGTELQNEDELAEQLELQEQVDEFIEERGIELPEGSERANLRAEEGVTGTGVATRVAEGEGVDEFTVAVDLPEPESGWYVAWLVNDEETVKLGRLTMTKSGFVGDFSVDEEVSGLNQVRISQETGEVEEPSNTVLEGSF